MGAIYLDLTGQRFGRLVAIEYMGRSTWKCRCDCGNYTTTTSSALRAKRVLTCGCGRSSARKKFYGCDDDCFNCKYPDCYKPEYLMKGGKNG